MPGVGEKTALGLLKKFKNLDEIYAHLDEVENRWRTKLEQGRDSAYLSRDLATIRTDLPIKLDLEQARARDFDAAVVTNFLTELEFRTLVAKVAALSGASDGRARPRSRAADGQMSLFEAPAALGRISARSSPPSKSARGHARETCRRWSGS